MLPITKVRDLTTSGPSQPGRPAFVSSASGLVRSQDRLYVVADDELHLGIFALDPGQAGTLVSLLDGKLPLDHDDRKAEKPDFEALVAVAGSLLAVPSGSKAKRNRGVLIPFNPDGSLSAARKLVNFAPLYERLSREFSELNIEGAIVTGTSFRLFQRGNGPSRENGVVDLDLAGVVAGLAAGSLPPDTVRKVTRYDLGRVSEIPYSFTDATALEDGRILFVAAAEDTKSTFDDGPCAGSAVGILDLKGKLVFFEAFSGCLKVEGVVATTTADAIEILFVTDGDDAASPAGLYSSRLSLSAGSRPPL